MNTVTIIEYVGLSSWCPDFSMIPVGEFTVDGLDGCVQSGRACCVGICVDHPRFGGARGNRRANSIVDIYEARAYRSRSYRRHPANRN